MYCLGVLPIAVTLLVPTIQASVGQDFANIFNNNSLFNYSDYGAPTPVLVRENGYPCEVHTVKTADGYILEMHRITGKLDRPPVFLQHGILETSADWVYTGDNNSLAYMLRRAGYDVWMGNYRGNTYSRNHITLNPNESPFWQFSWHEMGIYDLPAMIDYVLKITGKKQLYYVGHSMGTTGFFVMCSQRPEYNKKIIKMVGLAPVAFLAKTKSPLRLLAPIAPEIALFFPRGDIFSRGSFLDMFIDIFCVPYKYPFNICVYLIFIIFGYDLEQFPEDKIGIIFTHTPAGVSTKTLKHYAQIIVSADKFQFYDYGTKNTQIYNSTVPPEYDLSKVTVCCKLYGGYNDILAGPNYEELANRLPNATLEYVDYTLFNHQDFIWGDNVPELVYSKILLLINSTKHGCN